MDVDRSAPVIAEDSISIRASAGHIWKIMIDFERWPDWNTDIRSVRVEGPIAPGTRFSWKAGPGTIRSRVEEIEEPERLVWTGKTLGIRAVHVWTIEEHGGDSVVSTIESWNGIYVGLLKGSLHHTLEKSIHEGLSSLKCEAEKEAGGIDR